MTACFIVSIIFIFVVAFLLYFHKMFKDPINIDMTLIPFAAKTCNTCIYCDKTKGASNSGLCNKYNVFMIRSAGACYLYKEK